MKKPAKPTLGEHEAVLRKALSQVSVSIREMGDAGVYYPDSKQIWLDPFHGALLDSLIHELLHHAKYWKLAEWGALEEKVTEAVEDGVVRHINRNKRRVAWWRKALKAKSG